MGSHEQYVFLTTDVSQKFITTTRCCSFRLLYQLERVLWRHCGMLHATIMLDDVCWPGVCSPVASRILALTSPLLLHKIELHVD